jgi:hypothetical protein
MGAHWIRHSFAKHFHDSFTVGVNDAGWGTFDCRGTKQEAWPGTLNLIEPGETHTGQAAGPDGWLYGDFYIDPQCMAELVKQAGVDGAPKFSSTVVDDPELVTLFRLPFDSMIRAASNRLEQERSSAS